MARKKEEKPKIAKNASLEDIIGQINKENEEQVIATGIPEFDLTNQIPFSSPRLNYMLYGGLTRGRVYEFLGENNSGKAQPIDTLIPTPKGMRRLGDLKIGDCVFNRLGKKVKVKAIYIKGLLDCWEIQLSDNRKSKCCGEHLWTYVHFKDELCTRSLNSMLNKDNKLKSKKFIIPKCNPVEFESLPMKLNPYVLGSFLGDGCLREKYLTFSSKDSELPERLAKLMRMELKKCSKYNHSWAFYKHGKHVRTDEYFKTCKEIVGKYSLEQIIPIEYLFASVEDRFSLLQGLMDTDGSTFEIKGISKYSFSSGSIKLIESFVFLCRSLGITTGAIYTAKDGTHSITLRISNDICGRIFLLDRKKKRIIPKNHDFRGSAIEKITYCGKEEMLCISVDDSEGLYLTNDFIVTHNTTSALDLLGNAQKILAEEAKRLKIQEQKTLFVDVENSLDKLWSKTLGVSEHNLIVWKVRGTPAETIFERVYKMALTGELGFIVFDSIGACISQRAFDKSIEDATMGGISAALSIFSNKIETACKQFNTTFIGINQLRANFQNPFDIAHTVGGDAWKFIVSARLKFAKGTLLDEDGEDLNRHSETPAGNVVECAVIKTKTCRPDRRMGTYNLYYKTGIDILSDLVDVGVKVGVIRKRGAWFNFVDMKTGEILTDENGEELKFQGKNEVMKYLKEDDICKAEVTKAVNEAMKRVQ